MSRLTGLDESAMPQVASLVLQGPAWLSPGAATLTATRAAAR
jgi:hypothetical protein